MRILLCSWIANCLALYILAKLLPQGIHIESLDSEQGIITCMIGALILGIFNSILKPILNFLSFPITCLTLGLFTFVITGIVFYLAAMFTPGLHIASLWWAIIGGVGFGILNSIICGLLGIKKKRWKE